MRHVAPHEQRPERDETSAEVPQETVEVAAQAENLAKSVLARVLQPKPEAVDHPPHYNQHPSGVECIDVVEHMSFNVGNAVKYLWRADHKGAPLEDLKKAAWYIQREIEKRTKATGGEQSHG